MNQTEQKPRIIGAETRNEMNTKAIYDLRQEVGEAIVNLASGGIEAISRIEQLETCATLNAKTIGHVAELRRITTEQDERIEELGQRFTTIESGVRQGTSELKAIFHDICDRLERLESARRFVTAGEIARALGVYTTAVEPEP